MKPLLNRSAIRLLVLAAFLPLAGVAWLPAYDTGPDNPSTAAAAQPAAPDPRPWKPEELESLLAPVALYPDPLLAQVLAASTYPLELVEAQQWLNQHPQLKGKDLTDAAAKQDWDPSVQALVAFPDVLKRLTENVRWTTDLGNAFLAQQTDVMDAVQRLRMEAKDAGKLKTTREQEVTTRVVEERTIVEIVPASPEVVYVPVYSPEVIWGPGVLPVPGALLSALAVGCRFLGRFRRRRHHELVLPRVEQLVLLRLARVRRLGLGLGLGLARLGLGLRLGPVQLCHVQQLFLR